MGVSVYFNFDKNMLKIEKSTKIIWPNIFFWKRHNSHNHSCFFLVHSSDFMFMLIVKLMCILSYVILYYGYVWNNKRYSYLAALGILDYGIMDIMII